jgi:hypothetical protein
MKVEARRTNARMESGPSPFPLLVLTLVIAVLLLVRLRADEREGVEPVAMRAALPEMLQ